MSILPPKRKNKTEVFIEMEALLDLDIAYMKYLINNDTPNFFDLSFANLPIKELQKRKFEDMDFIYIPFKSLGLDKDGIKNAINEIYEEAFKDPIIMPELIRTAPEVQSIYKLTKLFDRVNNDIAAYRILVTKPELIPILKNRFPQMVFLDASGTDNLFKNCARIIIEDIDRLGTIYKDISYTHIAVIKYPKNIIVIDGETIINPKAINDMNNSTNVLEIIDPIIMGG